MLSILIQLLSCSLFFFFNDTATTEIYTLSLHDALPILDGHRDHDLMVRQDEPVAHRRFGHVLPEDHAEEHEDRKSTRLNSSHGYISYAVFCLKKKKKLKNAVYPIRTRGRIQRMLTSLAT